MPVRLEDVAKGLKLPNEWSAHADLVHDAIVIRTDMFRIVGDISRKEIDDNLAQTRIEEIVKRWT